VAANNGTLDNVGVRARGARNLAAGDNSVATQEIGKATGAGNTLTNVNVFAEDARNRATGPDTRAAQKIGVAE
jgi:hypothetical protein